MQFKPGYRFKLPRPLTKIAVFLLCALPAAALLYDALMGQLGANPIEEITDRTGDWALRLLLITLAVSPLRQYFGIKWLNKVRRMLGLFVFFYAILHVLTYIVLEQFFDWEEIFSELLQRSYLTVGLLAFLLMVPLALTSFNFAIKWLGKLRWMSLHRLVYLSAAFCVLHFLWSVKADYREPVIYAVLLLVLLATRVARERKVAPLIRSRPPSSDSGIGRSAPEARQQRL